MPVGFAIANSWHGVKKSNQPRSIKCAKNHAANRVQDDKKARGQQIKISHGEALTRQCNTVFEVGKFGQRTHNHVEMPSDFAFCHKASISSCPASSIVFPSFASSLSMYWNRVLNFL